MLGAVGCNYNVFNPPQPPNFVKVYPTGDETRIIEQFSAEDRAQTAVEAEYPNVLDEAFAVLRARAYPTPNPKGLIRAAVTAMCEEYENQTGQAVPSAHREAWIWNATRRETFTGVLAQLAKVRPAPSDMNALTEQGLRGLLRVAGPRSAQLYDRATAAAFKQVRSGKDQPEPGIVGIAVDNWPKVDVLPLSPAAQAGMADGDLIVSLNGHSVGPGTPAEKRNQLLEGPAGSKLTVIFRRGRKSYRTTVTRGSQAALSVRASIPSQGICYLKIPTFEGTGVAHRVEMLVKRARSAGVRAFLLDLRGNSGGSITEANAVADLFLGERPLQTFAFRIGRRVIFQGRPGKIDADVLVLTNRSTASAAEMLAMALRDNHRARIVGEDTFGALFGKEFHTLASGQMIFFRAELTIFSPEGEDYSLTGIPPDVAVQERFDGGRDAIYTAALQQARSSLVARAKPDQQ
jgi:carboxyl-terminal processing protease